MLGKSCGHIQQGKHDPAVRQPAVLHVLPSPHRGNFANLVPLQTATFRLPGVAHSTVFVVLVACHMCYIGGAELHNTTQYWFRLHELMPIALLLTVNVHDGRYVGDSEALLQHVFKQARLSAPSIIFLDEIDAMFGKRSASDSESVSVQLLATLLAEMDGLELATGVLQP